MSLEPLPEPRRSAFVTTQWTAVLQAAAGENESSRDAFGRLYSDYWYPLYAYVRRRGHAPPDAEDITQDFFVHLIHYEALDGLQREGGKFRTFLLRLLDNFLANHWDHNRAQKRGAGQARLSLDAAEGEARYALEPPEQTTPETLFERQWVFTLLANVLENLGREFGATGKTGLFADLRPYLQGDRQGAPYAEVAQRHGMSEGAVKVTVHRLRQRYGELLREEIARTTGGPDEVDEELRHLMTVVAG